MDDECETKPITEFLVRFRAGDRDAGERAAELLYAPLREAAARVLEHESQCVEPTVLVHEAWMRLDPGAAANRWENRAEFLRLAGHVMRHVLVDAARRRAAQKRGGANGAVPLESVTLAADSAGVNPIDALALEDALEQLGARDPDVLQIVELRYFAGMTLEETAAAVEQSVRQVRRTWEFARAWLRRELSRGI